MAQYKHYSLAKYRGASSKHKCPNCGEKTFKPYVDEDGTPFSADFENASAEVRMLADKVGRCDNERKCGWNYTPKQFFEETRTGVPKHKEGYKPPPPPTPAKPLSFELVKRSFQPYRATFVQFLRDVVKLPKGRLDQTLQDYWVGASNSGRIAYWMIDALGNCKDGKFMAYKPDGHRDHDQHPYWARKKLIQEYCKYGKISCQKRDELLDQEVIRPYFGEHLLNEERYKHRPVALVEGEKTCLICAVMYPRFLWMATGTNTFNQARLQTAIFQNRKIYIFPDLDQIEKWKKLAEDLHYGKVKVMDGFVQTWAESDKDDMGDIAMRYWMNGADEGQIMEAVKPRTAQKDGSQPRTAETEKPNMAQTRTAETEESEEEKAEMQKAIRVLQLQVAHERLGLTEPNTALAVLFEKLDLELVEDIQTEPDYMGF